MTMRVLGGLLFTSFCPRKCTIPILLWFLVVFVVKIVWQSCVR